MEVFRSSCFVSKVFFPHESQPAGPLMKTKRGPFNFHVSLFKGSGYVFQYVLLSPVTLNKIQ